MQSTSSELKLFSSQIVQAGAGAGKTTELIQVVLSRATEFKKAHNKWPVFVVTTFTIKATLELRERFLTESLKDKSENNLLEFTQNRSNLIIGTLHSVFAGILRDVAHLLDIDPNFTILETDVAFELKNTIAIETVKSNPEFEVLWQTFGLKELIRLSHLWQDHQQMISDQLIPMEVADIERLVQSYQLEAWKSFEESFAQLSTYILAEAKGKLSKSRSEFISYYTNLFQNGLTNQLSGLASFRSGANDSDDLKSWSKVFSAEKKKVTEAMGSPNSDPLEWKKSAEIYRVFHQFCTQFNKEYQSAKSKENLLEFSDLESLLYAAIRNDPVLFNELSQSFDGWYVDEFQDTNGTQDQILESLIGDKPVYLVGDPQQSIYRFRGADSARFAKHLAQFAGGKGEVKFLENNYRADASLTHFFNDYFRSFAHQEFKPQVPKPADTNAQQKAVAYFYREEEEAVPFAALLTRLDELLNAGVNLSEIKVLARTKSELKEVAKTLKEIGIPCSLMSGEDYFTKREVLDLRSFVLFLLNPWDDKNLLQLLRSPWFYVSDQLLAEWLKSKPKYYWQEFLKNKDKNVSIQRLQNYLEITKAIGVTEVLQIFLNESGFLDYADEMDTVGQFESATFRFISELDDRLRSGTKDLLKWLRSPTNSWTEDDNAQEPVATLREQSLGLMTIHASKGLTFPHVVLIGCHKETKPNTGRRLGLVRKENKFALYLPDNETETERVFIFEKAHRKELHEEDLLETDRLHYVALTRAQHSVTVIWSGQPKQNSFLGRINWNLAEGDHDAKNYKFVVRQITEAPTGFQFAPKAKLQALNEFKDELNPIVDELKLLPSRENSINLLTMQKMLKGSRIHLELELANVNTTDSWLTQLQEPPMKALMAGGKREWRFSFRDPETKEVNTRQIDLIGEIDDTVYIVDYKTGSSKYIEQIRAQLEEYKMALKSIYPKQKICAYAIFLGENKVIEI